MTLNYNYSEFKKCRRSIMDIYYNVIDDGLYWKYSIENHINDNFIKANFFMLNLVDCKSFKEDKIGIESL